MRLFIAVNISERSRELIARKVKLLKKELNPKLKWIKKENWHLTLKFLGECTEEQKEEIIEKLEEIEIRTSLEYIQFNSLNAFPNLKEPRVIFLEVVKGSEFLEQCKEIIEREMIKLGFKRDDREFTAHLSLARNKKSASIDFKDIFLDKNFINIYSKLNTISLYQSKLHPAGPEYIELFSKKIQ
ncbi:RNA 2',3'-cyclic phosphodiesterase [Halanaerobium hydrogeniformans]|uniref:RNA 2',3'-cyclic phosphodiesterase n=1 Tax=Halanaerobium hydrogeniformans TaxID=656519 RepID=E4RKJ6_HALHG|nr:RNA 2',3'-cyclic phosphodiesterase [Halanaerobium hydrogeniformans]ADQ14705.1 2'-5' RNA ligase [Halanaerobium hydrogeniformans]